MDDRIRDTISRRLVELRNIRAQLQTQLDGVANQIYILERVVAEADAPPPAPAQTQTQT